ncbi:inositol polyphosphate kinase family protein [Pseudoalteromonas mariniglutinosa]|uniref:inositol polyphosphate kinase family protein n=1 Tax=Pseudoalteromonas mariniglutinosa TaxID=206042 RepID=UPI00384AC2A8
MKLKKSPLIAGLAFAVLSNTALASQATDSQEDFSDAYQNYLTAVAANENVQQAAKQAFTLGKHVYGMGANNTANLAINYAKAMTGSSEETNKQRYALYELAYTILAKNHGDTSLQTIDALLGKANNTESAHKATTYLEQIISIASTQNTPKFVADMQFEAAYLLSHKFASEKYHKAKNYLEKADKYYQTNLPEDSVERIKSDFLVASYAQGNKKYNQAIERLTRVVNAFDNNLNYDHNAELTAHSILIGLYEKQGKSEKATKHCLAIAKMVPWKENQEQTPLYRVDPKYPHNKVQFRRDGSVEMEFEVNTAGFVKNINVLKSQGGIAFEKVAKEAVKQWRYAPKFKNGKPTNALTKVRLDFRIQ